MRKEKTLQIRLSEADKEKLREIAQAEKTTISELVRKAIENNTYRGTND